MSDAFLPVLVGGVQTVDRDPDPLALRSPLQATVDVVHATLSQQGLRLADVDRLFVVTVPQWNVVDQASPVADALGIDRSKVAVTDGGGQIPIQAANWSAQQIAKGDAKLVLIAGANSGRTHRVARKNDIQLDWLGRKATDPDLDPAVWGSYGKPMVSEIERAAQLDRPNRAYPMFESALRAARGQSLRDHRMAMGQVMTRFTEIAATNEHAWYPIARSAEEIVTPGPTNRMVATPYTKYLNSVMATDQTAAIAITSLDHAQKAGIDRSELVFWHGGTETAEHAWFMSERPNLATSTAMHAAAQGALSNAGVDVDDIGFFDLYSCFHVAVAIAMDGLGIDPTDSRPLTVTGGLPYAGGPGANYTTHAICSMADRLREAQAGTRGLTTGNGYVLTKHAAAVWGNSPPAELAFDPAPVYGSPDDALVVDTQAEGDATIDAYTVVFDRGDEPDYAIAIATTTNGARLVGNVPNDNEDFLRELVSTEAVGRRIRVAATSARAAPILHPE